MMRPMKQIAILRRKFDDRWDQLWGDLSHGGALDDAEGEDQDFCWSSWRSRFEGLLLDTFGDVFEDAKRNLEPKPPEFAYRTVRDWCLAADSRYRILIELENRLSSDGLDDWEGYLHELEIGVASEIPLTDMIYKPLSALCLEAIANLPHNSPALRLALSKIHPHLIDAMTSIQKDEGCSTLEEAVQHFPVLLGLQANELQLFRGKHIMTPRIAAKELLNARLKTVIGEETVERYFRPNPFKPK
jgi:hypothetical protein